MAGKNREAASGKLAWEESLSVRYNTDAACAPADNWAALLRNEYAQLH